MNDSQIWSSAPRLSPDAYAHVFDDLHPPLDAHEALVEADRCYFCYEAPCQKACPTSIDIPLFIRQIAADNDIGAAETIFEANILGGMCARVCPTETLCEEACVREYAEGKPVRIGLLQRHATDALMETARHPFVRGPETGKRIAVVGAGPAGLACAHRLAVLGHSVTLYDAKDKLGGLNEFGIAAYKTPHDFAQREVDFVLAIGGIDVRSGAALGRDIDMASLRHDFDAVFLGLGLAGVNQIGFGASLSGVVDAVDYIAQLRQSKDLSQVPVASRVVVIGGGMTAVDVAVQAKLLGAEEVTIVYRGQKAQMKASLYEQELAQTKGVLIRYGANPKSLVGEDGRLTGVTFARSQPAGATFTLDADIVFLAIGQKLVADAFGGAEVMTLEGGRIAIDSERRTSLPGVWAGGDCVAGGADLTVSAVEDGKQAALSIDRALHAARAA